MGLQIGVDIESNTFETPARQFGLALASFVAVQYIFLHARKHIHRMLATPPKPRNFHVNLENSDSGVAKNSLGRVKLNFPPGRILLCLLQRMLCIRRIENTTVVDNLSECSTEEPTHVVQRAIIRFVGMLR